MAGSPSASERAEDDVETLGVIAALAIDIGVGGGRGPWKNGAGGPNGQHHGGGSKATGGHIIAGNGMKPGGGYGNGP